MAWLQLENDSSEVGFFCFMPYFSAASTDPGLDLGKLSISWQRTFKEHDQIRRSQGHDTAALSAFMLTSLSTTLERKTLVKEMWESGAHVLVCLLNVPVHSPTHLVQGAY